MSDQSTQDGVTTFLRCPWCDEEIEPGRAGVHQAGLDSSRLSCPHQDLHAIREAEQEVAYGGFVFYVGRPG